MLICPTCQKHCDPGVLVCPIDGTPLTPGDLRIGQILGDRYRLLARIAEGGMGTIYRAEHVVLRKRVAVKVLRPELSVDEDLVRRFQQEAIAASQIGQENIVDVTDFGRAPDGALYFVMEELDGVSLATLLHEDGPFPVERAALVLAQVCRALAAAHGRGIVHRDLKPDNIVMVRREDGTEFVKVVDFGISKSGAGREEGMVTRAGTIIGTPEYMSPEQAAAAIVDHRADIYAFGVVAYELLTATLPFHGETAVATLLEHRTKDPEPPSQRRPGIPPELEAMILRALKKDPAARQQSMAEVAVDLTRVLTQLGLPAVYERVTFPPQPLVPAVRPGFTERFARLSGLRFPSKAAGTLALAPPAQSSRDTERGPMTRRRVLGAMLFTGLALSVVTGVAAMLRAGAVARRPVEMVQPATSTSLKGAVVDASVEVPGAPIPAATVSKPERGMSPSAPLPAAPQPTGPKPIRSGQKIKRGQILGEESHPGENPYGAVDDLKPVPF